MPTKRRFGISLPSKLAEDLDRLAAILGINRSKLIAEALETYIDFKRHLISPHECQGVMVLFSSKASSNKLHLDVLHEFEDIIRSHLHMHLEDTCINILIVKGSSKRIAELEARLRMSLKECRVYYVPLTGEDREQG